MRTYGVGLFESITVMTHALHSSSHFFECAPQIERVVLYKNT